VHKLWRIGRFLGWLAMLVALGGLARAETVVRVFAGPQSRSAIFRELLTQYMQVNPTIRIEIVGGEDPTAQRAFLEKALAAREPMLDVTLIDVLRPTQWAAERWIEPLDGYLGAEKASLASQYLPASLESAQVAGRVYALPFMVDAQFLYYRKDLLEKYALKPPESWDDLKAGVQTVLAGEKQRTLHGLAFAGAVVESATCTFLSALWGNDGALFKAGKPDLDDPAVAKAFSVLEDLKTARITRPDPAEVVTDQVRTDLTAGTVIYGLGWGYMWPRLQSEAGSRVEGKIGIAGPPASRPGAGAGCIGGWHVAVIAASPIKDEAFRFARFLSSPETARLLAIKAGVLPAYRALYSDPEVLAARPWFAEALPVLLRARMRPKSPRYTEISGAIRTNLHAVLAGTRTIDAALADMKNRFAVIFR
jgi:multiple sugar transport system substrate-binding protein